MKKRIVAAVLSLLLAASSVPMAEFASFLPDTAITATAATQTEYGTVKVVAPTGSEMEVKYTITTTDGKKTLSLTVPAGYFKKEDKIEVNTNNIKNALSAAGTATTGYTYVELKHSFSDVAYSTTARVEFKDSFITKIGSGMFSSNRTLTSVDLGSSIKYIGSSAFSGCSFFAGSGTNNTIDLSKVVEIEDNAFSGCITLAGAKFSTSLTTIGRSAFTGCTNIKSLSIPASVTSIGSSAFNNNSSLTTVAFASGSKLSVLGDNAFSNCSLLETVSVGGTTYNTLPSGTDTTPDDKGNADLGKNVFQNCVKLQNFTVPASYKYLPEGMFSNCSTLKTVDFTKATKLCSIGTRCFTKCAGIIEMTLPDSVKKINPAAFDGCTQLKKLLLPDGIEEFVPASSNTQTFANCPVLSMAPKSRANEIENKPNTILIPDGITHITAGCFLNCKGITSIDLNNVRTIAEGAFANCAALPEIAIPQPVTVLNKNLFNGCTNLKKVTYSSNLTEIKESVFYRCSSLSTFTPNGTNAIKNTLQITPSCQAIQESAFAESTSFKYINVLGGASSKLATLGIRAFSGCTSLEGATTDGTSSTELKFPSGVIVIRDNTFEKCTSLKAVQFEGNVTSIGKSVFQNCTSLEKVTLQPDKVTQIGESAFSGCSKLQKLPETSNGKSAITQLEKIDKNTFQNCTALTVVNISEAAKLKTIDASAFIGCSNMTKFIMPASGQVSSIGASAFQNCTKLAVVNTSASATKTSFPTSLINIGNYAFSNTALADITLTKPNTAGYYNVLGDNVFSSCASLTTVNFANSNLTSLPKSAFNGDKALVTVKLPTTLETIGDSAFSGCENLSTINSSTKGTAQLPNNVKTISAYAFTNCYNIAKFVIPAATDNIDLSAFNATLTYTQADIDSGKYNPLKEFSVASGNQNYKSVNGVLYNKSGTDLLRYPMMKAGKSFTIPNTVTHIVTAGMGSNNNLEIVKIGTGVTQIDAQAFNRMQTLRSVDFGTNTTVTIADNAFSSLSSNPKVVFYGASGSTAETYANKYSGYITFIDNNKKAVKMTIKQGTDIYTSRGNSIKLEAILTTASGEVTSDVIKWVSNDTNVASISNDGTLTPRKDGSTTVIATSGNGLTVTVHVNVGDQVVRLAGSGRYATAAEISKNSFETADTVVLANGLNSADALAGVPLAKAYNAPILLTTTPTLPTDTLNEIKRLKAKNVIILGGNGAISPNVEKILQNNGLTTERIAGGTRFETATKIAEKLAEKKGKKPTEIFFVYAYNFADALSASTVAAVKGAPVIYLKTTGDLDKQTADYLASVKGSVKQAYVIGGAGVISDPMMKTAASALGLTSGKTVTRVYGANRYATCVAVNKAFASSMTGTALCIATGADFPDALAGGVFAAIKSAPLFLVNNAAKKLDDTQTAYLKEKQAKKFFVFGGPGAVSDPTVNLVKAVK